ncbi:MAG: serine hydroxymethyltransferase, partial [Ekhidna sp.]|nr:serine hydroxymethyltransferase [Ekhidna sp.]
GKVYNPVFYGVEKETGIIDWDKVEQKALAEKPKMIICGASAYSRDWNYEQLRAVADKIGAVLLADISHPSGLIARGLLKNAVEYCHIVTTTTHKTLRGPRGGLILVGKNEENPLGIKNKKGKLRTLGGLLDSGVFPGTQGGPLEHIIAAKAVAFGEALSDDYLKYVKQVQTNARTLANAFVEKGYNIISGGTDNHMMLIDLRSKNLTGKQAEETLGLAEITINKNMVPFDDNSPMVTSGMRIGTAAITTRGLVESDMQTVCNLIDTVLMNIDNSSVIAEVKEEVNRWMSERPLFAYA